MASRRGQGRGGRGEGELECLAEGVGSAMVPGSAKRVAKAICPKLLNIDWPLTSSAVPRCTTVPRRPEGVPG